MPTFDNPVADATEASAALRGLAHATRQFTDPADTYPVIGDLLSGVRSLRQVLDQLAAAHIAPRARAHDDAGDQATGATSALAAADELHQAGTLLDSVAWRLDAASQHSGRIAWHPAPDPADAGAGRTSVQAGTLTLTVWPDEPLGQHQRYAYLIEHRDSGQSIQGRDLFTGAGAPVSPERALRDLAAYLTAAGDAHQHATDNGTAYEGPFDEWTADVARQNSDALTELADRGPQGPAPTVGEAAGVRWISVVFLQGSEAYEVLDLIDREGTDAAIEHLAGFDYGEETVQTALENGYVYDEPPTGALDKVATRDVYTLTYNPFLGHVSLLREHGALPDPALLGIDTPIPAPASTAASARVAHQPARANTQAANRERGAGDWFTRRPGAATAQGRGLAL